MFLKANCSACHTPSHTTGQSDIPALSEQTIFPYTDLLLHDMGEGLADDRPDFLATGREWRTPPLWGIGLVENVNGHTRFCTTDALATSPRLYSGTAARAKPRDRLS